MQLSTLTASLALFGVAMSAPPNSQPSSTGTSPAATDVAENDKRAITTKTFHTSSTKLVTVTKPRSTKTIKTSEFLSLQEPIPTYDEPKSTPTPTTGAASLTKPICYWQSEGSLYVSWVVIVPQYDGKSPSAMKGDFIGSIDGNSACRGVSPLKPGANEWWEVGPTKENVLFAFESSDFCTAYQMTKVIEATTGGKQSTACASFGSSGVDPDTSNTIADVWEKGEDGPVEEGTFKRSPAKQAGTQPISDVAMAKLLEMPSNSSHAELVQKLQGPSPLDKTWGPQS